MHLSLRYVKQGTRSFLNWIQWALMEKGSGSNKTFPIENQTLATNFCEFSWMNKKCKFLVVVEPNDFLLKTIVFSFESDNTSIALSGNFVSCDIASQKIYTYRCHINRVILWTRYDFYLLLSMRLLGATDEHCHLLFRKKGWNSTKIIFLKFQTA